MTIKIAVFSLMALFAVIGHYNHQRNYKTVSETLKKFLIVGLSW